MQTYRDVFLYLERTYLLREQTQTFWQMSLAILKTNLSETVQSRLVDGVLVLIEQDRQSETTEQRDLIAKIIHVMLALDFYEQFEAKFFG